jgi:hypothetical protein
MLAEHGQDQLAIGGEPMDDDRRPEIGGLLGDLRALIEAARERTATAINSEIVGLYWSIGERIRRDILCQERAEYGKQIVQTMSAQLTVEYGRGFDRTNLVHMIRFVETFPAQEIVYALSRQLGWTHFRTIIYLTDPLQRDFYAEMCRIERWSTGAKRHSRGRVLDRVAAARSAGP